MGMAVGDDLSYWARGTALAVARYAVIVATVGVLISVLPRTVAPRIQPRSPRPAQLRREAISSIVSAVIFSSILYVSVMAHLISPQPFESLPIWRWAVALLVLLIGHDTWFYWTHRLLHTRAFWPIHQLHHQSRTPTVLTAYAFHPLEALVNGAFILPASLITPLSYPVLVAFMVTMIARNAMAHGGREVFPAGRDGHPRLGWMTTVTHHDLHHQRGAGNYGLYFSFWDRIMGTERADYLDAYRRARNGASVGVPPQPIEGDPVAETPAAHSGQRP